jgi:hypothetical protein
MRSTRSVLAVVLSILVAAPGLLAQAHVAGQQALDAAVQQHVSAADQDRETVRLLLERSEVRAIAGKYGVDIRRAEGAVATMTPAELASVAAQARQADAALAGGQSSVTISTTMIIIGLLVLIVLILALR